jgi:hypothetical protein
VTKPITLKQIQQAVPVGYVARKKTRDDGHVYYEIVSLTDKKYMAVSACEGECRSFENWRDCVLAPAVAALRGN